ncbi:CLUMA_CG010401, isoform A [Clunio marinus]|uniref:CLUMA_CG010401, isoform A n=1 Tax=Clunio marinus TaxID=568069 RepID=A0A1J1IBH2_9DIPT|nr:CLUMA_CG010401, isoform A [Clunio marinus]
MSSEDEIGSETFLPWPHLCVSKQVSQERTWEGNLRYRKHYSESHFVSLLGRFLIPINVITDTIINDIMFNEKNIWVLMGSKRHVSDESEIN